MVKRLLLDDLLIGDSRAMVDSEAKQKYRACFPHAIFLFTSDAAKSLSPRPERCLVDVCAADSETFP